MVPQQVLATAVQTKLLLVCVGNVRQLRVEEELQLLAVWQIRTPFVHKEVATLVKLVVRMEVVRLQQVQPTILTVHNSIYHGRDLPVD